MRMQVLIDADGCPVTQIALALAKKHQIPVTLVCDTAHDFSKYGVPVITVDRGADSADFKLVSLLAPGDIVVTQDYGLAAMCLAKRAQALDQNGMPYTDENIEGLLAARHMAKKARNAGTRLRGPKKRTADKDSAFMAQFEKMLKIGEDKNVE